MSCPECQKYITEIRKLYAERRKAEIRRKWMRSELKLQAHALTKIREAVDEALVLIPEARSLKGK